MRDQIAAVDGQIDKAVYRLYNLTDEEIKRLKTRSAISIYAKQTAELPPMFADDYVSLSNSVIENAGDMLLRRVTEVAAEKAGVTLK